MKSFDDYISAQDLLGQYTHMHDTSLITISSFVSGWGPNKLKIIFLLKIKLLQQKFWFRPTCMIVILQFDNFL